MYPQLRFAALGFAINTGDLVALSYALGDSADASQTPGTVTARVLVNDTPNAAETVTNTAPDGDFKAFKSVLTATATGNLSIGFDNTTNNNWLDLVDVTVVSAAEAAAGQIPVSNFSFETEGNYSTGAWYELPTIGSWNKSNTNPYQILDISGATGHFSAGSAPEGSNVLNFGSVGTLTQETGYTVSSGQQVIIDFSLGDSESSGQDPGQVSVSILIDDVVNGSADLVTNTAGDGLFASFQSAFMTTSSGDLSFRFANSGDNNWLDNVTVTIIPEPSTFALAALGLVALLGYGRGRRR